MAEARNPSCSSKPHSHYPPLDSLNLRNLSVVKLQLLTTRRLSCEHQDAKKTFNSISGEITTNLEFMYLPVSVSNYIGEPLNLNNWALSVPSRQLLFNVYQVECEIFVKLFYPQPLTPCDSTRFAAADATLMKSSCSLAGTVYALLKLVFMHTDSNRSRAQKFVKTSLTSIKRRIVKILR
jgi:hypothetical protein